MTRRLATAARVSRLLFGVGLLVAVVMGVHIIPVVIASAAVMLIASALA